MNVRTLALLALPFLLALGCAKPTTAPNDYTKFHSENPTSILVVPAVNKTIDVTAPSYFLATLTYPIAERGYYVFPAYMVKRMMEDDGLSDATLVFNADPKRLASLFGADAILYVTIQKWDAKYALIATTVEVEFDYILKSGKTGDVLWKNHQSWVYTPQNRSSGNPLADLIAMAVTAAATKAAPNYMPLARQANANAFYPAHRGLPAGPHLETHGKDGAEF